MSHTPGPWEVYACHFDQFIRTNVYFELRCKEGAARVARAEGMTSESKANAHLMAAAPDLLAALEAVPLPSTSGECEADFCRRFFEWWESHAKLAIDKAKGAV